MHYCDRNFKTKKALKDAVADRLAYLNKPDQFVPGGVPRPVTVYNPETFSGEAPTPENGKVAVGGPHYPQAHVWYASVTVKNGEVVKVS